MSLDKLRDEVFRANSMLVENGLAALTRGNASGIDRKRGVVVIKPSGVSYNDMRPIDLPVVDLRSGRVVDGNLRPSSDTPTHLELYKAWPHIGGVAHTHSTFATAFAQAGMPVECYGTTHADFCPGPIPCVRVPARDEVETDYEKNTGIAIVEAYAEHGLEPLEFPGALLHHHGPFTWGATAIETADNACILENVAKIAYLSRMLAPGLGTTPGYILERHYRRKHGPDAYYGQTRPELVS